MATVKKKGSILRDWLNNHGLDPAKFVPDVWQMIHNNLLCLKDLAGLTHDELAIRVYDPQSRRTSGSRRVSITRNLNSRDLDKLTEMARGCGFHPLLLFVPNLRERATELVRQMSGAISAENSIFSALRKCKKCNHENRDPNARNCSQCGTKIV